MNWKRCARRWREVRGAAGRARPGGTLQNVGCRLQAQAAGCASLGLGNVGALHIARQWSTNSRHRPAKQDVSTRRCDQPSLICPKPGASLFLQAKTERRRARRTRTTCCASWCSCSAWRGRGPMAAERAPLTARCGGGGGSLRALSAGCGPHPDPGLASDQRHQTLSSSPPPPLWPNQAAFLPNTSPNCLALLPPLRCPRRQTAAAAPLRPPSLSRSRKPRCRRGVPLWWP
jgi:hypothetical protein